MPPLPGPASGSPPASLLAGNQPFSTQTPYDNTSFQLSGRRLIKTNHILRRFHRGYPLFYADRFRHIFSLTLCEYCPPCSVWPRPLATSRLWPPLGTRHARAYAYGIYGLGSPDAEKSPPLIPGEAVLGFPSRSQSTLLPWFCAGPSYSYAYALPGTLVTLPFAYPLP